MRKLRIYLDTSVINFLYADDAPDFKQVTVEFFDRYARESELYGSDVLLQELSMDTDPARKQRHLAALVKYGVAMLPQTEDAEVVRLAEAYVRHQVVSVRKRNDALHIAYATVFEMDVVLSWNFKHLANVRREARFAVVNQAEGYWRCPRIVSPLEVEDDSEE